MDSLTITIIFIGVSTIVGAFVKGRLRDKCLLDFTGDLVNIQLKDGKLIWGILNIEATGLELTYREPYLDKADDHCEMSYIIYKSELSNVQIIERYLDDLSDKRKVKRAATLKNIYGKKGIRKITRKIRNFFATVRDSIMEVANLLLGKVKQATPVSKTLSGQDKYVSQMQQGVISSLNASFEPLLEKHLGKKVILQFNKDGKKIEYRGILKSYTLEFLELMDVDYRRDEASQQRKADIIFPRSLGLVRHLGE